MMRFNDQCYGIASDNNAMMLIIDKLTKPTDVLSCDFYSAALEDEVVKDCCGAEVPMETYLKMPMDNGPNPTNDEQIKIEQI